MKYIGLVCIALLVLVGCQTQTTEGLFDETVLTGTSNEDACVQAEGTWLEDSQECEGISAEYCQEVGGTFIECASACRNDPDAEICTMQCVQVCSFA